MGCDEENIDGRSYPRDDYLSKGKHMDPEHSFVALTLEDKKRVFC